MTSSSKMKPTLMLIMLTAIWGLTFPATKAALETTTPLQFLALRFGIAALIVLPLILVSRRSREILRSGDPKTWIWGFGVGILLLGGYILQAAGMAYTTASRSGFFTGLLTVMTPILAVTFKTSKAPLTTWIGVPLAMAGIYFLADPETGGLNRGDILTIGCAALFAFQMVTLEAAANKSGGIERVVLILSIAQLVVGGIGSVVGATLEGKEMTVTPVGWIGVAYTAIFGSIIAIWIQTRYQPKVQAGHAALVFTLEPLFAALFAFFLLGDSWSQKGLIGAGLILAAMAVSSVGVKEK